MNQTFAFEHVPMKYCNAIAMSVNLILKRFTVIPTVVLEPSEIHRDTVRLLYIKVGTYFYIVIYSFMIEI